ncbi:phage tail assembly protein [Collimonas sp. OK607]|uniref:phage tail assembly protein n=1 Tax=Collimonas sp. OK607 TaxID=1798194 RepID=UPI001B8C9AC3|nr:phage tail assembly protein [Collimonas sp. OK607]
MNKQENTSPDATDSGMYKTVPLDEPLTRGDTLITEVQIRKPVAGELRGVSLMDLGNLDVVALQRVLPRITLPTLTPHDVAKLDLADLMSLGAEVAVFLLKKADRPVVYPNS